MTENPRSFSSLRNLARREPDWLAIKSGQDRFSGSKDRHYALVLTADIESTIHWGLRRLMVKLNPKDINNLFETRGAPLGTFSSKILFGHALGLFGLNTRDDLDCIREIRNAFAHARVELNFDVPEIVAVCNRLKIPKKLAPQSALNPKEAFRKTVSELMKALLVKASPPEKRRLMLDRADVIVLD